MSLLCLFRNHRHDHRRRRHRLRARRRILVVTVETLICNSLTYFSVQTKHLPSVKVLQLLVYTPNRCSRIYWHGLQYFSWTSKDRTPLPEDVAQANGHEGLAQYFQDVNTRYCVKLRLLDFYFCCSFWRSGSRNSSKAAAAVTAGAEPVTPAAVEAGGTTPGTGATEGAEAGVETGTVSGAESTADQQQQQEYEQQQG